MRGFDHVHQISGSTYRDCSTIVIIPTRSSVESPVPMIAQPVVASWQKLAQPLNQKRAMLFADGFEIGDAYNASVDLILKHPELSGWQYILTLEDDNIPPPDAHTRLLESIEGFDAVSGLYFTKSDPAFPMAFGDPDEFARTGEVNFRTRDVREALETGAVLPVNGIPMGCALWRLDLFRETPGPWFVTSTDPAVNVTQDLYACKRWTLEGKKFAIDTRVRVGHLDVRTGVVY